MSISGVSTATTGAAQSAIQAAEREESKSGKAADTLGYDAFLRLLVAQLQNQDPLQPMNSSDYVAQLATFSQVEKSVDMSKKIGELLATSRFEQAEGIIGKELTSQDGSIRGLVAASRVDAGDVIAVLADGREVKLGDGVTVGGARL